MIMNVPAFFQRFCQFQYEFSRIFLLILSISILPLLMKKKKMREIQIPGISYHFLHFLCFTFSEPNYPYISQPLKRTPKLQKLLKIISRKV